MRRISPSSALVLLLLSAAFGFGLIAGLPRPVQAQQDVAVRITADNAYGFGYGKAGAMASYFGGIENGLARDIFSCSPDYGVEAYTVPAAAVDDYLYIVAWSDKAVTQGVIAEFKAAGRTVYSGIGDWQVYATGQDFRPPSAGPGPSLDEINRHIGLANTAAGDPATTSVGWRGVAGPGHGLPDALAFGEANDDSAGAGDFPALACLDPRARWMWYNSDSARFANPFRGGPSPAGHKEFLIFRLGVREVVATPTTGAPDCLCEQVRKEAPAWLVDEAMAHPERFEGWRQRLDPGKPSGPLNPLRECLNLRHPNLAFHPLWNSVIWKVGCH